MLPRVLSELGFVASVFSSHPDESNIADKIIVTKVERNLVFIGLTRIIRNFGLILIQTQTFEPRRTHRENNL